MLVIADLRHERAPTGVPRPACQAPARSAIRPQLVPVGRSDAGPPHRRLRRRRRSKSSCSVRRAGWQARRPPGRRGRRPPATADMTEALFEPHGTASSRRLPRGPWDPRALHGGPPGALLARAIEAAPTDGSPFEVTRITIELLRPSLVLEAEVASTGPARCSWSRRRCVTPARARGSPGPAPCGSGRAGVRCRRIRCSPWIHRRPGPSARRAAQPLRRRLRRLPQPRRRAPLRRRVLARGRTGDCVDPAPGAGRRRRGAERTAAGRGSGGLRQRRQPRVPWETHTFINPDLSVHLLRPAVGPWVCSSTPARCSAPTASAWPRAPCSTSGAASAGRPRASSLDARLIRRPATGRGAHVARGGSATTPDLAFVTLTSP